MVTLQNADKALVLGQNYFLPKKTQKEVRIFLEKQWELDSWILGDLGLAILGFSLLVSAIPQDRVICGFKVTLPQSPLHHPVGNTDHFSHRNQDAPWGLTLGKARQMVGISVAVKDCSNHRSSAATLTGLLEGCVSRVQEGISWCGLLDHRY